MKLLHKLTLILPLLVFTAFQPACHHAMEDRSSIVEQKTAVAFAAASTVLVGLDAAETYYLDSLPHPTEAQIEASAHRVAVLTFSRSTLEKIRQHLSGQVNDDLRQVLADLLGIATEAEQSGLKLPPDVRKSLAILREVLS